MPWKWCTHLLLFDINLYSIVLLGQRCMIQQWVGFPHTLPFLMMYLTGWPSSRLVARSSLRLVGTLSAFCLLLLMLVVVLGDGEEEALLAVVVPERSSSLLLSLSLSNSDLVKRLSGGLGLASSSSSGGSGLGLSGVALALAFSFSLSL